MSRWTSRYQWLFSLLLLVLSAPTLMAQASSVHARTPVVAGMCRSSEEASAADALASKFDSHQFVFIGSTHGDFKIDEFLMCLITRPAFQQRATDILVEWASSAHQPLIDRYTLTSDQISVDDLAPIWLDTDSPTLWTTLPSVRRFVETLRKVNAAIPAAKRVRLIAGNEGVEWAKVRALEDLAPYPYKTNFVTHLITEHLAKTPGNRTLVIYGDAHIRYQGRNFMGDIEDAIGRGKLFVVGRIGELVQGERSFLATIGDPDNPFFVDAVRFPKDGPWPRSLRVSLEETSNRLADYIDAIIYLGPEPDKDMTGTIPLSVLQKRELERRSALTSDHQRTMQARFQGKDKWFRLHPNEYPPRPQAP